jgi:DNA-binding beta-propeller fold protein YncE
MNRSVLSLLLALPLAAQDSGAPVRGVTDPGTVTTRQAITPAGAQAVFQGRVYGVTFGADAGEIYVLQAKGIYRMDWKANRMLSHAALQGRMGLQGICYNPAAQNALAAYADAGGKVHLAASSSNSAVAVGTNIGKTNAGAVATNGKLAVVPLISQNQVAVVDLAAARGLGTVDTGIAPFGVAMNREGTVAYVTN